MGLEYRPLTDSFREFNRMLMEKQQWDQQHKLQQAEMGLKNLMAESQLKSAAQQQQMQAYKLKEMERYHTPKVVNLGLIAQGGPEQLQQIENNPTAMAELSRVIDDSGEYQYSPADRTWRHKDTKEPLNVAPAEMKYRLPGIYGIIDKHTDAVAGWNRNLTVMNNSLKAINGEIEKHKKKHPNDKGTLEEMMRAKQMTINGIKQHEQMLTPKFLMKYYRGQKEKQRRRAIYYQGIGAHELAASLNKAADNSAASERQMLDAFMKKEQNASKFASPQQLYAKKGGASYKGVEYEEGKGPVLRFAAGQSEMQAPPGFSFVKPDQQSVAGTDDFRQNFKIGADIVQKSALPQGMIIPHSPNKARFRDAADKEYSRLVNSLNGGVVDTAAKARALGHMALEKVAGRHTAIQQELSAYKKAKKKWGGKVEITAPDGTKVEVTNDELKAMVQELEERAYYELGYLPTWNIKKGNR